MKLSPERIVVIICVLLLGAGCANISPLPGGKKDITAPRLVSATPADSQLNIKPGRIDLRFNEYITVADASSQVQISPILPIQPTVTGLYKKVTIKIVDSLLQDNTTYRIFFGNAIKDLHEGNAFTGYTYTFSTGNYFDSLELHGSVLNAVTGLPDTGAILVSLYSLKDNDSAIVRKKPLYIAPSGKTGFFSFKGMPISSFHIYALKDYNNNMIYDGPPEWIGFADSIVHAGDTITPPVQIRIFQEPVDTAKKKTDTANNGKPVKPMMAKTKDKAGFEYGLNLDTTNVRNRSKDINKPIEVSFNKTIGQFNRERISLGYDSMGVNALVNFDIAHDTINNKLLLSTPWIENAVYTLKLLKGFAKDTGGRDAMPSKYIFRTKRDEDYAKLDVHLSPKYVASDYILLVKNDRDTIYNGHTADTMVHLLRLSPAEYTILIIVDRNGNGKWDPGNLFQKIQPEIVIPYGNTVPLKAGWENTIDMIPAAETRKKGDTNKNTK